MTIESVLASRGIEEIVHFTPHNGLLGMLHSGFVKSRQRLPVELELEHIYTPNAHIRRDVAWLDYVNLSISQINLQFFETSCRWHRATDLWWCILSFDPCILTHTGVYFATTNNMYTSVSRGEGVEALERLFQPRTLLYGSKVVTREECKALNLSTCPQAEVLYPHQLSLDYLRTVYVKTGEDQDEVHAQLALTGRGGVEVAVAPARFGDNEAV